MTNDLLKKSIPHIIALVVFLLVSVFFCKPVLEGNVLSQQDTIGWKGAAENAFKYKEEHGHFPLWNPNMFSGMPNYQIAMHGKSILPDMTKVLSFGLPKPINFFFLACICFYILCLSFRIRPVIGMIASLAYAFSTYNAVVIAAGHDTQMLATAFLPLLIAGLVNIYEKRYWLGFAITTFAAYQQVACNHLQISYYAFIIAALVTIAYVAVWIINKDWKHLLYAGAITIVAAIIGIAGNALILKTTSEYAAYTMRGGKQINIAGDTVTNTKTKGLDTSYAFEYSLGNAETFTLLMHNSFGGSSGSTFGENSKVVKRLTEKGIGEADAIQVAGSLPRYWGALPYTAGPAYLGVMIFILGLIGFVIVKTPVRWALLAATIFGVLISWGKNFAGFNVFLFEHLPMYNKFRAPSMAQVIPQFAMGLAAALATQHLLFNEKSKEFLRNDFKKLLIAVGALFGVLILLYLGMSYSSPLDSGLKNYLSQLTRGDIEFTDVIMSAIKAERKSMFGGQLLRAMLFAAILLGSLFFYARNTLKPMVVSIIILVLSTLELTIVSKQYLKDEDYVSPDDFQTQNFAPTAIDNEILKDKDPNYRVFNMAANSFGETRTSALHKSVGGYHPAKLRIYQDIIEKYLSSRPNPQVLNMLNTRYVIVQDPQTQQPSLITNPDAYGACWLVKNVRIVDDAAAAITAIGKTNLKDTAIVEKSFAALVTQPSPDSSSTIRMTKYDNDEIQYEANCNGNQFAVFSEIYYPKGWNVYVDEKKTDYVNADYILRGLSLPAGKHNIKFVFEPASFKSGVSIMYISSFLILIILLGGLFMAWRESRKS